VVRNGIRENAVHSGLDFDGKTRQALVLSKFTDDLGARTLRALLLRNSIVCALNVGGITVSAWAVRIALDLSTMASIAGPLLDSTHDEG
jgi:hypothetical protein